MLTKSGFDFSTCNYICERKDSILNKGKLKRHDVVLTTRGTVGNTAYFSDYVPYENIRINSGMIVLRSKKGENYALYIYSLLNSFIAKKSIENYLSGFAQPHLPIKDLKKIPFIIPDDDTIQSFAKAVKPIYLNIDLLKQEVLALKKFTDVLSSEMSTMELAK